MSTRDLKLKAFVLVSLVSMLTVSLWIRSTDARSDVVTHAPSTLSLTQFQRLSYDLRGRSLDAAERKTIQEAVAAGDSAVTTLYTHDVDHWLTKDALKSYVGAFMRFPAAAVAAPDAETFFERLSRYSSGASAVYYLPHDAIASAGAPCPESAVMSVAAWWSKTPVRICAGSYIPEKIFDDVGYCSGEAEPLMRQPPRAGCGCGPMLMGCLPPTGENAPLDQLVRSSVSDEWFETAARIVAEGRPLDELVTTSKTWQTGLAEFIYARREVLAEYRASTWGPELSKRIATRLQSIDVYAPGHWVDRKGIYAGSGLWWTALAASSLKQPVRSAAHHLLDRHLCMSFTSVNVDADAVLKAVGDHPENLRTLSSLTAAPMRFEAGCKGCHAPMDGAAGFMGDIQGPIYGSYLTGVRSEGEFFVAGDRDRRGKGVGSAALAKFIVAAPEFESCSVRRAFEQVLQSPPTASEQPLYQRLTKEFHSNGHRWMPILRELLLSDAYLQQGMPGVVEIPKDVPAPIAKLIGSACTRCHNAQHILDLTRLPAASDVATWKKILSRVSDYSMPPPRVDQQLADRFPLDLGERKKFIVNVTKMLGSALEVPPAPRRMPHGVWISIVRRVAEASIGHDRVSELLGPLVSTDGFFGNLPPRGLPAPYVLAVETASEAICREVARVDDQAKTYGIAPGDWTPDVKSNAVSKLMTAVYGSPPTESELASSLALLDRFQQVTHDWRESWTGLCSAELSGPRLFFGDYVGVGAR